MNAQQKAKTLAPKHLLLRKSPEERAARAAGQTRLDGDLHYGYLDHSNKTVSKHA